MKLMDDFEGMLYCRVSECIYNRVPVTILSKALHCSTDTMNCRIWNLKSRTHKITRVICTPHEFHLCIALPIEQCFTVSCQMSTCQIIWIEWSTTICILCASLPDKNKACSMSWKSNRTDGLAPSIFTAIGSLLLPRIKQPMYSFTGKFTGWVTGAAVLTPGLMAVSPTC